MNPQHSPAGVRSRPPLILRAGVGLRRRDERISQAWAQLRWRRSEAGSIRHEPAQGAGPPAEAAVDSLAGGELGGEDFAPPQPGEDRVATSLAATWLPRPASDRRRRPSGQDSTGGSGSALTSWTAGAHVPAIQLSSLPLDEWHYMRHNEAGRVRLRTARIGTPRWRTAARRPAGPVRRRRPQMPLVRTARRTPSSATATRQDEHMGDTNLELDVQTPSAAITEVAKGMSDLRDALHAWPILRSVTHRSPCWRRTCERRTRARLRCRWSAQWSGPATSGRA